MSPGFGFQAGRNAVQHCFLCPVWLCLVVFVLFESCGRTLMSCGRTLMSCCRTPESCGRTQRVKQVPASPAAFISTAVCLLSSCAPVFMSNVFAGRPGCPAAACMLTGRDGLCYSPGTRPLFAAPFRVSGSSFQVSGLRFFIPSTLLRAGPSSLILPPSSFILCPAVLWSNPPFVLRSVNP